MTEVHLVELLVIDGVSTDIKRVPWESVVLRCSHSPWLSDHYKTTPYRQSQHRE